MDVEVAAAQQSSPRPLALVRRENMGLFSSRTVYTLNYTYTCTAVLQDGEHHVELNLAGENAEYGIQPDKRPWRLAVDGDKNVYFTVNAPIGGFGIIDSMNGEKKAMFVECKLKNTCKSVPVRGITVSSGGRPVVYITADHVVQKYVSGKPVAEIGDGESGKEVNQFDDPNGICLHKGCVYVCDSGNKRIQVLSEDLDWKKTTVFQVSMLEHPEDLDFDGEDNMYVVDSQRKCIVVFDSRHIFATCIPLPCRVFPVSLRIISLTAGEKCICISDRSAHCFALYNMEGRIERRADLYNSTGHASVSDGPIGLAVDREGHLYVANCSGGEIQMF